MQQQNISQFGDKISQLDQLLRLFRCCKKEFSAQISQDVQNQIKIIIQQLKNISPNLFKQAQSKINYFIQKSFAAQLIPEKKIVKKPPSQISNLKSSTPASIKQICQDLKPNKKLNFVTSGNSPFSSSQVIQSKKNTEERSLQQSNKFIASSSSIEENARQIFTQNQSFQISGSSNTSVNFKQIKTYVKNNIDDIQKKLAINKDLMVDAKLQKGQVYLVGLHLEPKRPIICTKMKLLIQQIQERQDKFQDQVIEFRNTQRHPTGIFVNGDISNLKPHYIYLLGTVDAPWPFIFLMKNMTTYQGHLVMYNRSITERIMQSDFKMLNTPFMKDLATNPQNFKLINILDEIQLQKEKGIVSKTLIKPQKKNIPQQAKDAIQIMDENNIKEQQSNISPNINTCQCKFPYKLHTKFLTSSKGNFDIYIPNNEGVLQGRRTFKDYAGFEKQALQTTKKPFVLSLGITKSEKEIDKAFLALILKTNPQEPYGLVNLVTIKFKKTLLFKIMPEMTEQKLLQEPQITFDMFQKEENTLSIIKIDIINSKNLKTYESEQKVDLIQIKPPKK